MEGLSVGTFATIAAMVMRGLAEAPDLVHAFESFWLHVVGNPGAPAHIDAAVKAAIASIKEPTLP
jgi:3-dehydroquinate dehydratase